VIGLDRPSALLAWLAGVSVLSWPMALSRRVGPSVGQLLPNGRHGIGRPPLRHRRLRPWRVQPPVGASEMPVSVPLFASLGELPSALPLSSPPDELLLDNPPSSPLGALQVMTMAPSSGLAVDGPQVSPFAKHSADMPQSWSTPSMVRGHGPAWQFDVKLLVPQQTWPGRQPAEVLQVMPLPGVGGRP
jgi:hypothetical protein